ncbi:MAG: hypothetical protein FJW40_03910 [Acidobacteria bacterium]|nr:hypothetical protein [Acidobacteriota bacterium]
MTNITRIFAGAVAALLAPAAELPPAAKVKVDFNRDIQPLLEAKCHSCHGAKQQQSGLRLDKRQNALRGGDYGPVIVAGQSAESKLVKRLVDGAGGMIMPPTGALAAHEIGLIRAWIDQGADFGNVEIKEEKPAPVDPAVTALISAVKARDEAAMGRILAASPKAATGTDAGGSTALHHAAAFGTAGILKTLLERGAAVEARNRFGHTPLHWAFAHPDHVKLLAERGADINARASNGRTVLFLAAAQRESDTVLRFLLSRGADPNLAATNGDTPLMAASANGETGMMRLLLDHKAKVNAVSGTGSTALIKASASTNPRAVAMLMAAGADVKTRTKLNETALHAASTAGSEETARMLMDKQADIHVRDVRGYSALMYAAYSEETPAGIVKMLLEKGADRAVTGEGETPVSLAAKRGDTEVARLLGVPEDVRRQGGVAPLPRARAAGQPAQAAERALASLAPQSATFIKKSGCNSCHNQFLPSAARGLALERGLRAPAAIEQLGLEQAERYSERAIDMTVAGVGSVGYELFDFAMNHRPANAYTDAVAHYVRAMQLPSGGWQTLAIRPPMSWDNFITTAMAVNVLRVYSPAGQKQDTKERLERAARWLDATEARNTQEKAFRLLGLVWANGPAAAVDRAASALLAAQRADGGWSQLPAMGSDAYATGQALYALQVAGRGRQTAAFRNGMAYLLRTQAEDGTWHVRTRSIPIQPYFDAGFPYAHDQWISAAGTSWAAMALTLAAEAPAKLSRGE